MPTFGSETSCNEIHSQSLRRYSQIHSFLVLAYSLDFKYKPIFFFFFKKFIFLYVPKNILLLSVNARVSRVYYTRPINGHRYVRRFLSQNTTRKSFSNFFFSCLPFWKKTRVRCNTTTRSLCPIVLLKYPDNIISCSVRSLRESERADPHSIETIAFSRVRYVLIKIRETLTVSG